MATFTKPLRATTLVAAIGTALTASPVANAAPAGLPGGIDAGVRGEAVADNGGGVHGGGAGLHAGAIHAGTGNGVRPVWHRGYGNWRDGAWVGAGWQWYGAYGSPGNYTDGAAYYCNPTSSYYDQDYCTGN